VIPQDQPAPVTQHPQVSDASTHGDTLRGLLESHEQYRRNCLNLVAAENVMSPQARAALSSEMVDRYGDYVGRDLRARKYRGTRYMVAIEEEVHAILRTLFRAEYVEPRPLSGHIAGAAAILAFTKPGDLVFELDSPGGGHRLAEKLNAVHHAYLRVHPLPMDIRSYSVDAARTIELAHELHPRMIILGSSLFLFPHPVREIAAGLADLPETMLVYDASHVLGLIAGSQFQDPLREGAAVVWSSTHKTFPGPPGGLIMTQDADLIERASSAVYPGLVTNHVPGRMPALGIAASEMLLHGPKYAATIVANARRLGAELDALGVPVVGAALGYSQSHTLLLPVAGRGTGSEIAAVLEEAGIITTSSKLPPEMGTEGIRLGLQEITRRGAGPEDMPRIGGLLADVLLSRRSATAVQADVRNFVADFPTTRYTLEETPS
jgi:glycine hydroxymethyltransferase